MLGLILPAAAFAQFPWPFPAPQTQPQPGTQPQTQPQPQPQTQPQPQPQTQPQVQPQVQPAGATCPLADLLTQAGFKGVTSEDANTATLGIQIQESGNKFTIWVKFTDDRSKVLVYTFLPFQAEPGQVPAAVEEYRLSRTAFGLQHGHSRP